MFNRFFALIKITRPINCLIIFITTIVTGFIAQTKGTISYNLIFAALAALLTGAAGNVINDYFDFEIDKINRPKRVLPSGVLTKNQSLLFYLILVIAIFTIAVFLNVISLIIVVLTNLILLIYSFKLKKVVLVGNLTIAFLTGLTFIYGAAIVDNIGWGIIPASFAFFINFIREIVKDIEDIEGDVRDKVYTFPYVYGIKKSNVVIILLSVFLILLTVLPFVLGYYKIEYFIVVMVTVNPVLVYNIKLIYRENNKNNYSLISKLLKLNMLLGLIAIYLGK